MSYHILHTLNNKRYITISTTNKNPKLIYKGKGSKRMDESVIFLFCLFVCFLRIFFLQGCRIFLKINLKKL